jgi:hypothetical protein
MLTHFILSTVFRLSRRVYFKDGGRVAWANYHKANGDKVFSKKLF